MEVDYVFVENEAVDAALHERLEARRLRNLEDSGDESDPDNPKYLAKLSKGFAYKLKEQKDTIQMLQGILLNSQAVSKKKDAFYKKLEKRVKFLEGKQSDREGNGIRPLVEGKNPFSIFAEELWLLIFDKLDNSQDVLNCNKASAEFEKALESSRSSWLFAMALPFFFHKLSKKDILNCRVVNKRWNGAINNFMENYEKKRPYGAKRMSTKPSTFYNTLAVKGLETVKNPHFSLPANELEDTAETLPMVPGRSVTFQYCVPYGHAHGHGHEHGHGFDQVMQNQARLPQRDYWRRVESFLERCGKDIWYLNVVLDAHETSESVFFNVITSLLRHVPNIRHLGIGGDVLAREDFVPDADELPAFANLESLLVLFRREDLKLEQAFITKYGSQVGKIETSKWMDGFSQMKMGSLVELKVFLEPWGQQIRFGRDVMDAYPGAPVLDRLLQINSTETNIQKLVLGPIASADCFKRLFKLINGLPKLKALCIWFGSLTTISKTSEFQNMTTIFRELPPEIMAPPNLQSLEVDNSVKSLNYVFLTRFPFIKELHIRHDKGDTWNNTMFDIDIFMKGKREFVEIQKYIYKGLMYRSNVWEILSGLEVLTFLHPGRPGSRCGAHHPPKPGYDYEFYRQVYEVRKHLPLPPMKKKEEDPMD